ncbi:unnamed protein product [Acanthosepion pharaonis]|uniref:Uncharacterized protein n=1 Tax=Acanthosepion pharaonis TaxID=158019 RepID=A0A812BML3_ACAPH|nr:unnamed protein product [Sepia pharaonis]
MSWRADGTRPNVPLQWPRCGLRARQNDTHDKSSGPNASIVSPPGHFMFISFSLYTYIRTVSIYLSLFTSIYLSIYPVPYLPVLSPLSLLSFYRFACPSPSLPLLITFEASFCLIYNSPFVFISSSISFLSSLFLTLFPFLSTSFIILIFFLPLLHPLPSSRERFLSPSLLNFLPPLLIYVLLSLFVFAYSLWSLYFSFGLLYFPLYLFSSFLSFFFKLFLISSVVSSYSFHSLLSLSLSFYCLFILILFPSLSFNIFTVSFSLFFSPLNSSAHHFRIHHGRRPDGHSPCGRWSVSLYDTVYGRLLIRPIHYQPLATFRCTFFLSFFLSYQSIPLFSSHYLSIYLSI